MVEFTWRIELQQTFYRFKKELTDETLRLSIPNSKKPFYNLCDASNYVIGAALLQKYQCGKVELISANFRLLSAKELRLPTILRECFAIIYAFQFLNMNCLFKDHHTLLFYILTTNL